jgi:hypothetical protein
MNNNRKNKIKKGMLYVLCVVISLFLDCGIAWLVTCGIIKLITLCFGLSFKWGIATGVWLIILFLKLTFAVANNK